MSPSRNNTSYLHQFFCSLIRSPTRLDWCTAKIPDPKMARKKHPGVVLHKLALGPGGKLWANIAWMLLLANGDTNFEGLQRPNARMNMQIWNTKCTYQLIISHDIQNHIHNFHFPSVIYHNHIMYLFSSAPQATLTLVRPSKGCNQQTFSIICPQIPSGASSISSASVDGGWNTWWKMHACSSSK